MPRCSPYKGQVSLIQQKDAVSAIQNNIVFARRRIIFKSRETLKTKHLDFESPTRNKPKLNEEERREGLVELRMTTKLAKI